MARVSSADAASTDGQNLVPLLKNRESHLARGALFFHYPHYYGTTSPVSAVRAGDWKLLEYHEDRHVELYNLRDDLSEKTDLASSMTDKAKELCTRLHDWLASVGAQMPTENVDFKPAPPIKRQPR